MESVYRNTYIGFYTRFAYRERLVRHLGENIAQPSAYPIIAMYYEKGVSDWWQSDFNYNKLEIRVNQAFFIKNIGTLKYRIETGYIDRPVPYGLLFTGRGSLDKKVPFLINWHFQTMQPYEFAADKYVNLFFSHNFGGLLFKTKHFQPEIELLHHAGIGSLSNKELHQNINFNTNKKLYLEAGCMLYNLLRFDVYNIYIFKLGGGSFIRYGSYAHPDFTDNITAKIALQLSLN